MTTHPDEQEHSMNPNKRIDEITRKLDRIAENATSARNAPDYAKEVEYHEILTNAARRMARRGEDLLSAIENAIDFGA